jgi:hypothetical protein
VTVDGRLVVTFNEVGLPAAVAGLGLVSMTVGAARKEISEGLLVRVLADWDVGAVDPHAVFPTRKAAKPSKAIRISRARLPRGTGLSSSSKRNCVRSSRNGPNETSVGVAPVGSVRFSKSGLAASGR